MATQKNDSSVCDATTPSPSVATEALTSAQLHALFDILTHHETYTEVESFKDPHTISEYGYPFALRGSETNSTPSYAPNPAAPLLAGLLRSIVLSCPGIRDMPAEFWHVKLQGILERLAGAELSESYDKGTLDIRKTLATAASAIHEAVSRGLLGRIRKSEPVNLQGEYNRSSARDLARAWDDAVQELVHGNLVEELFKCAAEKQSIEEHSSGIQAAADYIIIHLAALIHDVFIVSPEGPYVLKLLENAHKLLPYSLVKQTLRIGNAATMLSGMMRLVLAKLGVGALSNWAGLTQNADDGMNLLQRIISMVLSWDASGFRKGAEAIEKAKGGSGASKEQLAAIRKYVNEPREKHDDCRRASIQKAQPMVAVILERSEPELSASLSEAQLTECSEYLAALLAVRDREQIISALCRQSPDLLTQAVKDTVATFEPMIRSIHERVDLREHVTAGEAFLNEFINVSSSQKRRPKLQGRNTPQPNTVEMCVPSVEDYVLLLRNNRQLLYNWFHHYASRCPGLREDLSAWAIETIKVFRQNAQPSPLPAVDLGAGHAQPARPGPDTKQRPGAAGDLSANLQQLFASLPQETQQRILPAIDAHATYLSALEDLSLSRMQRILDNLNTPPTTSATPPPTTTANTTTTASNNTAPTAPTSYFSPAYWSGRSTPRSPPTPAAKSPPASTPLPPRPGHSFCGPGMYLSRWQQLLDETVIGPAHRGGVVRRGREVKGLVARGKVGGGGSRDKGSRDGACRWDPALLAELREAEEEEAGARPPDVACVVDALGQPFRVLVGGLVEVVRGGGGGAGEGDVEKGR